MTHHQAIPDDPVNVIARYSSHSSVVKIKKVFEGNSFFEFTDIDTVHKLVIGH